MSRVPGFVLPLGSCPFDDCRDLLWQPGEVLAVERLDVRVRRGLLHPDGGPASLDGHDDLQVLRRTGLVSNGLLLGVINTLWVLFGRLVGVLLIGNRGLRVVRRIAEETLVSARGI